MSSLSNIIDGFNFNVTTTEDMVDCIVDNPGLRYNNCEITMDDIVKIYPGFQNNTELMEKLHTRVLLYMQCQELKNKIEIKNYI